jgi:hypothetical protein
MKGTISPYVFPGIKKEEDLNKGEILGITYSNLDPVLTKAIQEQQKQIEELKSLISSFKK